MAIVDMSRFSLMAFDADREELLKQLQAFQDVHFLDLRDEGLGEGVAMIDQDVRVDRIQEDLAQLDWMLKLLQASDTRPTGLSGMRQGLPTYSFDEMRQKAEEIDFKKDYYELREIQSKLDGFAQARNDKQAQIALLKPWESLPFYPAQVDSLKQVRVQYGSVLRRFVDSFKEDFAELELSDYQVVAELGGQYYLVILGHHDETEELQDVLRRNGVSPITLDVKQPVVDEIAQLHQEISQIEEESRDWQAKLPEYAPRMSDYELVHEAKSNELLKLGATRNFLKTDRLTLIQGFIPTKLEAEFTQKLDQELGDDYYVEMVPADRDDPAVPILLKNNPFVESFSSITSMYALPKYNEVDPTPFFAPFYWMFFGMMGADVGYGLLIMLVTGIALKAFNLKPSLRQFVRFFFFLSFSMVLWGLIYGSFFGDLIALPSLIDTNQDFMLMLVVSMALGLVHLFFGLALKAYVLIRDGKPMDAIYDVLSWYLALGGGILWLVSGIAKLPPVWTTVGKVAMIIGMVMILVFAGRDSKSFVGRLVGGLYELYGISSYVGDFVSYSRLMALGLAGGFIGVALNMIVKMLFGGGIIGIVFGVVVFAGFHAFNIFLSGLGAYVHTSRLTYVEFFGKFYEGGGKAFRRFRSTPKYIEIKEK